jgi:hypothetical protein
MEVRTSRGVEYALDKQLEVEIENLREHLAQAGAEDFAQYQFICGKIRGIRLAIEVLSRVRKRLEPDEDVE